MFAYNPPSSKFNRHSELLERMMYMDTTSQVKLRKLTEAEVGSLSENIIRKIFTSVEKFFDKDPALKEFTSSKGDVTRIDQYDKFMQSLKETAKILGDNKTLIHIMTINGFLLRNKNLFVEGFNQENRNVQLYYCSLAMSMMAAQAMLLTSMVQVISGSPTFSKSLKKADLTNVVYASISSASDDINSGKALVFVQSSLKKGSELKESFVIPIAFAIAISIFWFMRDMVVFFFKVRHNMSKWMESYAVFLDMRSLSMQSHMPKSAEKYKSISKKFMSIAEYIRVEADVANKETVTDLNKISAESNTNFVNNNLDDSIVM